MKKIFIFLSCLSLFQITFCAEKKHIDDKQREVNRNEFSIPSLPNYPSVSFSSVLRGNSAYVVYKSGNATVIAKKDLVSGAYGEQARTTPTHLDFILEGKTFPLDKTGPLAKRTNNDYAQLALKLGQLVKTGNLKGPTPGLYTPRPQSTGNYSDNTTPSTTPRPLRTPPKKQRGRSHYGRTVSVPSEVKFLKREKKLSASSESL